MSIMIIIDDKQVDVTSLSTARIVELYNQLAFELDEDPVKRFATRPKAEGRLIAIADRHRLAHPKPAKKDDLMFQGKLAEHKQASELDDPDVKAMMATNGGIAPAPKTVKESPAPAPKPSPAPAPAAPAAAGTPRWARPKDERPAKIAYKPRPGSSQAQMYDLLTQPGGIDINKFCAAMVKAGIKDKTLHTPPSVWSCLRYLFVTSKGYGLSFDGTHIQLLVPKDEREPNGHKA